MVGRSRRARDHGDSLLCCARGQFYRRARRSDRRGRRLPGLGGPLRGASRRHPARAVLREPGGAGQDPGPDRGRADPASHRVPARLGQHRRGRQRHAPPGRGPRRTGGIIRRGDPHPAPGRLPGAHVHRLRSPVPGPAAHPGQGRGVQHAPAGHRRPAPVPGRQPVVDDGAARSARLGRRPAASHVRRSPPGGPAGLRSHRRSRGGGLAGPLASPGPTAPLRGRGLAVRAADGCPLGTRARRTVAEPPDPRPVLRRRDTAQAPAAAAARRRRRIRPGIEL